VGSELCLRVSARTPLEGFRDASLGAGIQLLGR
jgi:hypothetical protein